MNRLHHGLYIVIALLLLSLVCVLNLETPCEKSDRLKAEIVSLNVDIDKTSEELQSLESLIINKEKELISLERIIDNKLFDAECESDYRYVLHCKLYQDRTTQNTIDALTGEWGDLIANGIKDNLNATLFDLEVSKNTWANYKANESLLESFRTGSAISEGTASSWTIKIIKKSKTKRYE